MRALSVPHLRRHAADSHGNPHGQVRERIARGPTGPAAGSRDQVAKAGVNRTTSGARPPFCARRSAGKGNRNAMRRIRKCLQLAPSRRRREISATRASACDSFRNPTTHTVAVPLSAGVTRLSLMPPREVAGLASW